MLSSIGRAAIRRGGAGARVCRISTNRTAPAAWHIQNNHASQGADNLQAQYQVVFRFLRGYATTTKVATKAPAKKTKAKTTGAKKGAKKPVKKAPKKPTKKAVKKPKKKVLTEKQETAASIRGLKAKALSVPVNKPYTVWQLVLVDTLKASSPQGSATVTRGATEAAAKYKSLTPQELESYNHRVNQNKAANEAALKQWVESHTPEQIRIANNARTLLKRKLGKPGQFTLIPDSRIPKRPRSAYILHVQERLSSGDFKDIKASDAITLISNEWKALNPSQKKTFEDHAAVEKERYSKEFRTAFHREPSESAKATKTTA